MIKRMRYGFLALAGAVAMAVSCQSEDLLVPDATVGQDGYVAVEFSASVPDMEVITTKAVDPDGEDITGLKIFCFNARGLFISVEDASDVSSTGFAGTYKVELPIVTDRVHIVANLHKAIDENAFLGRTESEVLATMTGSSGMMSYWARVTKGNNADISAALKSTTVQLLRDHARITVVNKTTEYSDDDLAFVAINTNAFGTVAPFNNGAWVAPSKDNMFVTLPEDDRKVTGYTDVVAVSEREYQYVFETENTSDEPVYVIIRATKNSDTKYYRVMLLDENGEYLPVMRNFTYKVMISGDMDYGQDTFQAALDAPVTNNVWVSVSDDIKEVSGNGYTLSVKETHVVLGEDDQVFNTIHKQYSVHYTLESTDDLTAADVPEIIWLDGNDVAQHTFASSSFVISADKKTAEGRVDITLFDLGKDQPKREGTLLIKKGLLERKVNIITLAKQSFTPAWITTNIYGGEVGSNVTMMFHIDENCPEAFFPIDVLVSVNDMDVRNASGMVLPVITAEDKRYGIDNGIGYKYVLTVTEPGDQRIYLETILEHQKSETISVTIEAKNFEPLTKTATFQEDVDSRILIHNLRSYVAATPADEYIYYYLVPQKINAPVEFDTHIGKVVDNSAAADLTLTDPIGNRTYFEYIAPNVDYSADGGYNVDEFLLYSQNLEHNHDAGTTYFDFYQIDASKWSNTAGRVMGLIRNTNNSSEKGAKLHLKTRSPKANEVVRIASNPFGQVSVTTGTKGSLAKEDYSVATSTGTGTYKSVIFELATFHPFHFSAQVKNGLTVVGGKETGRTAPEEEIVEFTYVPGQDVDVEFDITSFMSDLQGIADEEQMSVDPFGTEFEVYVDAPTLELDEAAVEAAGLSGKIYKDSSIPGRVIYKVAKDREDERNSLKSGFYADALVEDNAALDCVTKEPVTTDQTKERKVIPFKTKDIVSAGTITLSSDETKVVYFKKTFNIHNTPMRGNLYYGSSSTPVPAGTFVPFSAEDGTRIGVVAVGQNGAFELRLRAEYQFSWTSTKVKFETKIGSDEYKKEFASLEALYAALSSDVVLE